MNNRSGVDRRSGADRRKHKTIDHFLKGGVERRLCVERRGPEERRVGWARLNKWSGVFVAGLYGRK